MTPTDDRKPAVTLHYPAELVKAPPVPVPGIKVDENVYVTMRDGIRLAVDVYRPEQDGRYPVLLSLSPYNKDMQRKPPQWSTRSNRARLPSTYRRGTSMSSHKAAAAG